MFAEEIRDFCLLKKHAEECFPFDNDTLVFKVGGKIFLLISIDSKPIQFNAKCDPDKAIELRENHSFIIPGYHMNKKHWNTIICESSASRKLLEECINNSYNLIVAALAKKTRQELSL